MFAIYPKVDNSNVSKHAVIFTDDCAMAERLCLALDKWEHAGKYEAYLVMTSWPDAKLINNLNGCPENVWFSTREPKSAERASHVIRELLR